MEPVLPFDAVAPMPTPPTALLDVRAPSRLLTGTERVWLASDRAWSPFAVLFVLEGEGALDVEAWRRALERVLPAWPGARARLSGVLGWTRWVADGAPPRVRELEGAWDGRGPAPFLETPLDPVRGPIVEIVLLPAVGRVVFRLHHAAFDGRAAWGFAEDVAAVLRGEAPRGAAFAGVSDRALAREARPEPALRENAWVPRVAALGSAAARWTRFSFPDPGPRVLPRAVAALARAVDRTLRQPGDAAPLRVSIPVDLRPRFGLDRVSANLTGFVRVEVPPGASSAVAALGLDAALREQDPRAALRAADATRTIPVGWMAALGRRAAHRALLRGRGGTSATVSNLGRLSLAAVTVPGFTPKHVFWIPPAGLGSPLFLLLSGHEGGLDMCLGVPEACDAALNPLAGAFMEAWTAA